MAGVLKIFIKKIVPYSNILLIVPVPLVYYLIHTGLNSSGGWLTVGFYELIPLLGLTGFFWKKRRTLFETAGIITMVILAILMVGEILFLPYQAYELWFDLFRAGVERGRVSHLFVKLGSWLTALICWLTIRRHTIARTLKNSLYLPLFFLFILWPTIVTAILFLATLLWGRLTKESLKGMTILLIFASLIGLTGYNTKAKGARFIDQSSDNLITFMTERWPSIPLIYDVPLYGESLSREMEDGGRPALTNNTIFTVTGRPGDQIYLRNRIYSQPGQNFDAIMLKELVPFTGSIPEGSRSISIRIITDYINMVPFTENTAILDMGEIKYRVEHKEKTLLPDPALFMDDTYVLVEQKDREYPLIEDEAEKNIYLQTPLISQPDMENLAQALKGNDPIQTVRNIRNYLTTNYTYTLNTEESNNYTEDFLFNTKEGYCLHFASSFVALARLNEIPCRYVEGYLVNFPSEEDFIENYGSMPEIITASVSGLSSHVWPEIYLDDRGWVSFEVTSPFVRGDSLTSTDRLTRQQLAEIQGFKPAEVKKKYFWKKIPPQIYPIIFVVFLLFWLILQLHSRIQNRRNRSSYIINRFIRRAKRAGISLPEERGWIIWEREISQNISKGADSIFHSMPLILRSRYTNEELSHEEKSILKEGYLAFKAACKSTKN